MTPSEFLNAVLIPAFNADDSIATVDEALVSIGVDDVVLDVVMADGSPLQITIATPVDYRADMRGI